MGEEEKLVLLLARSRLSEQTIKRIQSLSSEKLNWNNVFKKAKSQALVPLLVQNLESCNLNIPKQILKKNKKESNENVVANLLVFEEAKRLIYTLNKERIKAIFLKGISVAKKFDKDFLKTVGDIDLLVKKEDIGRIEKVLYAEGWATTSVMYPLVKEHRLKESYELPSFCNGKSSLDLHWKLSKTLEIGLTELYPNAIEFDLDGVKTRQFSPEDQLIYLCAHSFLDHGGEFIVKDLVDINETISFYENKLDWVKLLKTAEKWKVSASAYHCLSLAKKSLGSPIPESALNELKRRSNKLQLFFLRMVNEENLFSTDKKMTAFVKFFARFFQLSLAKKAEFLFKSLFPSDAFLLHFYGVPNKKSALVFYRLCNPLRLLFKALKAILG